MQRTPKSKLNIFLQYSNLAGIRRWRDYKRILTDYGVVVFPRSGYDSPALKSDLEAERSTENGREESGYRIRLRETGMVDISSTEIREGIASGRDMSEFLM